MPPTKPLLFTSFTVNQPIFSAVLFLRYSLTRLIRYIKTTLKFSLYIYDKEEDNHGVAKIKSGENVEMCTLATIEPS